MRFLFLFILTLFLQTSFAQTVGSNEVTFNTEERFAGSKKKSLKVTVKKIEGNVYMDFKRKGVFFQVKLTALDPSTFDRYDLLKNNDEKDEVLNYLDFTTSIGYYANQKYFSTSLQTLSVFYKEKNNRPHLVMVFPETQEEGGPLFQAREVTFSDSDIDLIKYILNPNTGQNSFY